MNVFVTGASGFIGTVFAHKLKKSLRKDDHVFLLIRKEMDFGDKRFEPVIGSLEEIDKFRDKILKCEYVFHIAANATFGNKADYEGTNFQPTKKIVDILKDSKNIKNFIFTSTIGAVDRHKKDLCLSPLDKQSIPSPKSKYGESKLKSEKYISESGIPYTIIRPTWVYGPHMRAKSHINLFVTMAYNSHPLTKLNFQGKVSLIHVDDLAESFVNCIGNKKAIGKIYFAETESKSFGELFRIAREKAHEVRGTDGAQETRGKKFSQIPVPSFKHIVNKLHGFLPVPVSNLFIDYLYVIDNDFKKDLLKNAKTIKISDGIDSVIATNVHAAGYWVITGANSGIGLALSRKLLVQKKRLILIDKNIDTLSKEFQNGTAIIIKADLSKDKEIDSIIEQLDKYPIYCLVNNAGIGYRKSFESLTLSEIEHIIAVNIKSHLRITKLLLSKLQKEHSIIVNVASSIAYNPLPNMLLYSSTKAFISNWSESLTYELKDTNRVITFSPSGTNTNFQNNAGVKKEDSGRGLKTPEYVAEKILQAVKKNKTVVILDLKTNILLFCSKFLPRKANIMFWGKIFQKMR